MKLFFNVLIAASLIGLGVFILVQQHAAIPGLRSASLYYVYPPGHIFVALACFSFAASLLVMVWNKQYKRIGLALFLSSFIFFGIGFFMADTSTFSLDGFEFSD